MSEEHGRIKPCSVNAGELVPIGEVVVSGLDDVPAIRDGSPQARHHFTVADQVDLLVAERRKRTPIAVSWRG